MQERNVINGTTTALVSPLLYFYENLIPFLLLAIVLIFVDSRFGVAAARKRGEQIRSSRKWRRAINKLVDYICWISIACVMGGSFGRIFGIPLLPSITMLGVCIIELLPIIDNYCESLGIKKKFNG